jgi:hypothetical protein
MPPDHRDMPLEHFALTEAELLDHIHALECDIAAYRVLLQESIKALAALTTQHHRLREAQVRLLEELGYLREQQRQQAAEISASSEAA